MVNPLIQTQRKVSDMDTLEGEERHSIYWAPGALHTLLHLLFHKNPRS